jgi:hypothetical protein
VQDTFTRRRAAAQQQDFLDAALRSGKRVSLDVLLPLEWRWWRQLGDPCPLDQLRGRRRDAQWRADAQLIARNPCLLSTAEECEGAKYQVPWPADDAPVAEHVGRFLLHIRGKWSYHVWGERQRALPFEQYIADYVGDRLGIGKCYLSDGPAAQLLRLATGQPRFLPTKNRQCE